MPTVAHRVRCNFNPQIQWFHPPLRAHGWGAQPEPSSVDFDAEGAITGLDPETWATEVGFLFDRLCASAVGRALTGAVRLRTTIYPAGNAQTDADPFEDEPGAFPVEHGEQVARDAATTGANARMWFDIHGRTEQAGGTVQSEPVVSLAHELVHAVNITWGNYQVRTFFTEPERQRYGAPTPEEEIAWVIDNMYRSERGLWLRRQYDGTAMLPPGSVPSARTTGTELSTSEARVVSRMRLRVRMLASALERIDARTCPYNPFRSYARLSSVSRP